MRKWNGNEMHLDGGDQGNAAESGAEFLLPYWMSRYYGYVPLQNPRRKMNSEEDFLSGLSGDSLQV